MPPRGGHHYLDGDGMVHVCRIKGGKVRFANRWVQTERLEKERELGKPYYLKVGLGRVVMGWGKLGQARRRWGDIG